MKTARFADVVKAGGAPETYLLWVPAADDKTFQRAVKEHRIMTVHQELRGAKRDYGLVGFHEEPNAQWLMFPKSVKRFEDRRVVGINYDLLAKSDRPAPSAAKKKPESKKVKPERAPVPIAPRREPSKIVEFERPAPPEPAATPPPKSAARSERVPPREPERKQMTAPVASAALVPARFVSELEKAMKQLKAGKTVAAYERLSALLNDARKS
ncbi:MAG: hypothetical protein ABIZ04_13410 [Opitutus sp.]